MNEKDLARNILTNVFPEECRTVGPNSLNDLLSGDVTIVPPEEGRPFPLMEVFEFLKEAAQFIIAAYSVYKILRDQFGRKPTLRELKQETAKQAKRGSLSDKQIENLLKEIQKLD
ncbi:hypothetical protein AAFG07_33280 [Bradyrhizobium sp. B097]|uniref:hypothetical protein n=1 Tax=Bradyrhizobium sp. B097 TaxID=3140244 RepID=UPI003183ACA7